MRKMKKRARIGVSFLLCLVMVMSLSRVGGEAAEILANQDSGEDWRARFGYGAEVVLGDDGEPVLVNGYPFREVRGGFNNLEQEDSFQFSVDFMDYPFWRSAGQYDGNLAVMSLAMALSANRADLFLDLPDEAFDPSLNLEHFLEDAGFERIRKDDYSKTPSRYTVSTAMGSRKMAAEGQEPFTLIAIGVCGGRYSNEWESNMTPGDGDVHEGFLSAAQLVVDRLSGYIHMEGIRGRIKVWISGYSRAAAVSNLVAAMLDDAGVFSRDDIYAYTYATPAVVKNPPQEGYGNIFNIVNPMDMVPQVLPAQWGYDRYGRTLYLPTLEFSSEMGILQRIIREEEGKNIFGVETNYSPELNLRMRILLSMIMDLLESKENYNEQYQPALMSIMEDKSVSNTLSLLQALMWNLRNQSSEDRERLDATVDYVLRVFRASVTRSELASADRNAGSAFIRLFTEHTENSYLSCTPLIAEGIFEENTDSIYVMVRGPVRVTASMDDEANILTMDSRGKITYGSDFEESPGDTDIRDFLYTERCGNTSVIAVPDHQRFRVRVEAEKDGEAEVMLFRLTVKAATASEGYRSGVISLKAGENLLVFDDSRDEDEVAPILKPATLKGLDIARFMGIDSMGMNWRVMLNLVVLILGLILCGPICLILSRMKRYRKQYPFPIWALLCLLGVSVLGAETASWFFADMPVIHIGWLTLGMLLTLAVGIWMNRQTKEKDWLLLLVVLLGYVCLGVTFIDWMYGKILWILVMLAMAGCFLRKPMSRRRWISWFLLSAVSATVITLGFLRQYGPDVWVIVASIPVLSLLAYSGRKQAEHVWRGATMFILGHILDAMCATVTYAPAVHVLGFILICTGMTCMLMRWGETSRET